jgi:hypothetical protein
MDLPATRAAAIRQGVPFYFTGKPCKHGHVAKRETKGNCVECRRIETAEAAHRRAEYFREYNRREDVRDRKHEWYTNNSISVRQRASLTPREKRREYQEAWKQRNPDRVKASNKSRRRKHRDATPPWLTAAQKAEIREIYRIAIHMTKATGEQYVVDHICPLRADTVCGLHVPWNLRVITQEENLRKSNSLTEVREAHTPLPPAENP